MENKTQFNLLPDLKQEVVKADRTKKLVTSVAVIATLISVSIFLIMLFSVYGVQKAQLHQADTQIKETNAELKKTDNLEKILTVQNQLASLSAIHKEKHISSRIFDYLPQITPVNVGLSNLNLDFETNAMQIDGRADSQKTVNTFADTLKFTTYTLGENSKATKAFPSVVESSFGINSNGTNFSLTITFDPVLFSNSTVDSSGKPVTPKLNVPTLTTTRSAISDPSNVFNQGGGN